MKIEVLFVRHKLDFTKEICSHFTSIDRLMSGEDTFPYNEVEIVAKRRFTGRVTVSGDEVYEGDIMQQLDPQGFAPVLVEWSEQESGFVIDGITNLTDTIVTNDELVVIGDKWRTPDLQPI